MSSRPAWRNHICICIQCTLPRSEIAKKVHEVQEKVHEVCANCFSGTNLSLAPSTLKIPVGTVQGNGPNQSDTAAAESNPNQVRSVAKQDTNSPQYKIQALRNQFPALDEAQAQAYVKFCLVKLVSGAPFLFWSSMVVRGRSRKVFALIFSCNEMFLQTSFALPSFFLLPCRRVFYHPCSLPFRQFFGFQRLGFGGCQTISLANVWSVRMNTSKEKTLSSILHLELDDLLMFELLSSSALLGSGAFSQEAKGQRVFQTLGSIQLETRTLYKRLSAVSRLFVI